MFLFSLLNLRKEKELHISHPLLFQKRIIFSFLGFLLGVSTGFSQIQNFQYYADSLGITHQYITPSDYGGGISWADFDGDGWDDFSFGSAPGEPLYLFRNVGGTLVPQSIQPFAADTGAARSLTWVDFDNDADKDLFVTHEYGPNRLYRNDGNWTFTDVTVSAGIGMDVMYSYSSCWGDYDLDGFLDCYVVNRNQANIFNSPNRLYHNNQDGTFTEVAVQAGVDDFQGLGFSAGFIDFNNDTWPDLVVTNDKHYSGNRLFQNLGNGTFVNVSDTLTTGLGIDGMGTAIGDYDGNGYLDIYITNTPWSSTNFGGNVLCRNHGNGTFTEVGDSSQVRVSLVGWGANFFDYDHDQDEDLFVANGTMGQGFSGFNTLFENRGNGVFVNDSLDPITDMEGMSFGSSIGDLNRDGFYEVAVINGDSSGLEIWKNQTTANHWIGIGVEGVVTNRDGIGVWIEVWTQGQKQVRYTMCGNSYASQHSNTYLIGLGSHALADSLRLAWPSGSTTTYQDIMGDAFYHFLEDTAQTIVNCQIDPSFSSTDSLLSVQFQDQTPGNGLGYLWDFGDNSTSSLANPTHSYATEGNYTVCLTVFNACDTATTCDTVSVFSTSRSVIRAGEKLELYPQPFSDYLTISGLPPGLVRLDLYTLAGIKIESMQVAGGIQHQLNLAEYPSGTYLLKITANGLNRAIKVVKK